MTKIDYSQLSDDEIDRLVVSRLVKAGKLTDDHDDTSGTPYTSDGWCWGAGVKTNLWKDGKPFVTHPRGGYRLEFCKNPAVAWPIIVENRISIMFDGTDSQYEGEHHEWCDVISPCQKYSVQYQSNPLRAAMIVFLEMQ